MVLLTSYGFEFLGLLRHLSNVSDGQGVFFSSLVLLSHQLSETLGYMLADVDILSSQSAESTRTLMRCLLIAGLRQNRLGAGQLAVNDL